MRTDDLIADLSQSPWPTVRPAVRVAAAMIGGWLIALVGLMLIVGPPLTAVAETGATPFALKVGFTLALAIVSTLAALAAGRPGQRLTPQLALIGLPFVVIAMAAGIELYSVGPGAWESLLLGTSFFSCMTAVSLASVPVLAGMFWAYRELAPTRPTLAGFLTGLSAGAAAAVAYALYCTETTASFLIAAYTPAMLVPACIGALLGSRLLRW
jgi:hypothetical protein